MKIGLVVNTKKSNAQKVVTQLVKFLIQKDIKPVFLKKDAEELGFKKFGESPAQFLADLSLIIALGGDGTILRTVNLLKEREVPVLGINLASFGFLTCFVPDEGIDALEKFLTGKAKIEKRMICEVKFKKENFFILNEGAVNMGKALRMIEVIIYANSQYVSSFSGDGVIVSTPTGSTAYSLACGGPIVHPTSEVFVITPISPHILSTRPIVLPAFTKIKLKLGKKNPPAYLVLDGQIRRTLNKDEEVEFQKAARKLLLIVPEDKEYFEILRRKLKWGGSYL